MSLSDQSNSGPRDDGGRWCCSCGVWDNGQNGLEECPVSRVRMGTERGLSHLWAYGIHKRAMEVWESDANIRARSSLVGSAT